MQMTETHPAPASNEANAGNGTAEILELVLFRALPGVADSQVLAAADALQRDVEGLPGYLSRRLLKAGDGTWVDTVRWTSLDAALAAAGAIEAKPSAHAFMQIVDPQSIQMLHAQLVQEYASR
jgi:hypothetical protein